MHVTPYISGLKKNLAILFCALEKKRISERKRRENIKADPEKWKKMQEKERQKNLHKKNSGKIKKVADMSERDVRIHRKKKPRPCVSFSKKATRKANKITVSIKG